MFVSSFVMCKPTVTIRAQIKHCPGVTYLEFDHSESRYNPGFTVEIKSPWFNMTLFPEEVESACRGIKTGSLSLLPSNLGDEFLPLIQKGVDNVRKMMEAVK
ncbi:hypothetical protein [Escherichia phage 4E8]|nr:hypothetical protein [Escherichia phage 4E8]